MAKNLILGQILTIFGHFVTILVIFSSFEKMAIFSMPWIFLGGPGTINQQKIEICLSFFTGLLEPSKTIYLPKISSFQAFLVILWDFYKF